MIEAIALTKTYGEHRAVDDLSFTVQPGTVTGFLGPNGAGKSTTMRMLMGLDRPTSGAARIDGRSYADHRAPLHEVGALLEARAVHPGRSARNHLLALAATSRIPRSRVEEVLDLVGLSDVAQQRVAAFSLGMGQRLGVAAAMLGDPHTLILDEPVNGLDLDGIRWIRALLTRLAREGRTVFLSSHLMSEMAMTADHVIVVGRGRLLRDQTMTTFIDEATVASVRVLTPDPGRLTQLVRRRPGATVEADEQGEQLEAGPALTVTGMTSRDIGDLAAQAGITLWELTPVIGSLEDAYLALTRDVVEHSERSPASTTAGPAAPVGPAGSDGSAGSASGRTALS